MSTSSTMKPAATIAAFKFSVSAKSAAALRKLRKVLIRLSGLHDLLPRCALKFFKTSVSQAPTA